MSRTRVVVAMSGGVDSSVAAALVKEGGYDVIGVTMRLWPLEQPDLPRGHQGCCSVEAIDEARRVCQVLEIPYYVLNFEAEFQSHVVGPFCREYGRGRTPNPCIACNQHLKFNFLMQKALALGAEYLATGHYACVEERQGVFHLLKAIDPRKDQSYALYTLSQAELSRLLLPVGHLRKEETRRKAAAFGLPVAEKADSQEICFIPEGSYREFLSERMHLFPGEILDTSGRVVGTHEGVALYTVGQRRGLGIPARAALYVLDIDASRNVLVVGSREDCMKKTLIAGELSFVSRQPPGTPLAITAKIRYRSPEAEATLSVTDGRAEVQFAERQWAITPGQAVVFYLGEEVLGGGVIDGGGQ
ncbi:MAG: tRNA 2-thiouridine(34) synthase MnmA [Chloroflexi bacterium]|nr:tRNA 2-thiouridine(34) synthase MnmA [Chloroflexota bacterium]